ncbi:MAG: NUDIX domain-containing protein [Clostridiales bacterium]|nr:NUDIX domain-containing protein [Clostridiales bacterium]
MKKLQLINDDFTGKIEHLRHASRGVVIKDGRVLLSYETKYNKYMIPGGGVEDGESYAECCERELLEETGIRVKATDEYVQIEELFDNWRHVCHYFVCEFIEDTGIQHLTDGEKAAGYVSKWVDLDEAIKDFGDYERFHKDNIADYGLYRREYYALKEYKEIK